MKKIIPIIFVLIALLPFVSAAQISVSTTPIISSILPGETAQYELEITNSGATDEFTFASNSVDWSYTVNHQTLTIPAGKSAKVIVTVTQKNQALTPKYYGLPLIIYSKSNSDLRVEEVLSIKLNSLATTFAISLLTPPNGLQPNKENLITIELTNENAIDLTNLKVKVSSSFFTGEKPVDLTKQSTQTVEFTASLKDISLQGNQDFNIKVYQGDKLLHDSTHNIFIGDYESSAELEDVENSFLITKTIITKQNNGNTEKQEFYNLRLGSIEKLFTTFSPEPTSLEERNNNYYATWEFTIPPQSEYIITATTDYLRPVILLIILILLGCIIYNVLTSGITVKKKVLTLKVKDKVSEVKVLLILKNKSKGVIKNVRVMDTVSDLSEPPTEFSTMRPNIIKKGPAGTILIWDIPELVKGEERVLSYKVKSSVQIIGRAFMSQAICRYKNKIGKNIVTHSNRALFPEQP